MISRLSASCCVASSAAVRGVVGGIDRRPCLVAATARVDAASRSLAARWNTCVNIYVFGGAAI